MFSKLLAAGLPRSICSQDIPVSDNTKVSNLLVADGLGAFGIVLEARLCRAAGCDIVGLSVDPFLKHADSKCDGSHSTVGNVSITPH